MLTLKHLTLALVECVTYIRLLSFLVTCLQCRASRNMCLKKSRHATAHEVRSIPTSRASIKTRAEARSATGVRPPWKKKKRRGAVTETRHGTVTTASG